MTTVLVILLIILVVAYTLVRIMKPLPVHVSAFEIERRVGEGDTEAHLLRERRRALPFLWSLWWFIGVIILLAIGATLTGLVGPSGFLLGVILVLSIAWLERWSPIRTRGEKLFAKVEPRLQAVYKKRKYLFFLPVRKARPAQRIASEAELLHLIDGATFLGKDRRALINSALEFTGLAVSDAMSGKRSIHAVDKSDVLGPLLVDELYKTGKQAFVVTDGDIDTVVGILKLERLTSLDMHDSPAALKAMTPEVHFIDETAPITDALSYLRSSKAPFLVVQDDDSHTVGLLTMDNILRCLFES